MERALMFTACELIICVTPRAPGSELALSRKKQKTIPPSIPRCSGRFYSAQCKIQREETSYFFSSKSAQRSLGTSARQYYSSK